MSDERPIGIFDSGLGGLAVTKEVIKTLPYESIVYIGDTARVPYGNRSPQTVQQFSKEMVQFLLDHHVKAIVVACATASASALTYLKQTFPTIPIIGVIDASAQDAVKRTSTGSIGIIGTRTTIASGAFEQAIKSYGKPEIIITNQACPLLAPTIEEGILNGPIINTELQYYLDQFISNSPSTLILGCTHYPLLITEIRKLLPNTTLINAGTATAIQLKEILTQQQLTTSSNKPTYSFFATDVTPNFTNTAALFMGQTIEITKYQLPNTN